MVYGMTRSYGGRLAGLALATAATLGMGAISARAAAFPPAGADIYDTFTVGDGTGTTGAQIAGTAFEGGGGTWAELSNGEDWQYTSDGEAVFSNITQNGSIYAGLPDVTDKVVTVQAEVDRGDANYIGIALANVNFFNRSIYFVRQGDSYNISIAQASGAGDAGERVKFASGTIASTGGLEELVLTYNLADNTVSASVNGTAVLTDFDFDTQTYGSPATHFDTSGLDGTDQIINKAIIFHSRDVSPSATPVLGRADNFAVTISPVPEPGSLALLGLGGLVMLRRRKNGGR